MAQDNRFNIETDRDVELINWETDRLLVQRANNDDSGSERSSLAPSEPGQAARMRRAVPMHQVHHPSQQEASGASRASGGSPVTTQKLENRMQALRENADRRGAERAKVKQVEDADLQVKAAEWKNIHRQEEAQA